MSTAEVTEQVLSLKASDRLISQVVSGSCQASSLSALMCKKLSRRSMNYYKNSVQ